MGFIDSVFADQDRQRRERSVFGVVVALVTGRMGDGTYELKYLGMGGDAPSAPARMLSPNAGRKRGVFWMPEAGDEVVVAFENGDTNAPIILGALYNGQSPPPDAANPSAENNVRTVVSRTGHEVTLDDSPGAGKVTVRTAGGRTLTLDDTPPGKASLATPGGISVVLDDGAGTLTLTAPASIVLAAPALALNVGGVAVDVPAGLGSGTVTIAAPAAVTVQSAVITLTTGGTMPTSAVVIDGKPFGLHVHGLPPPSGVPPTPPVLP